MYSFDEKIPTILCEIMQKYGSDKGGKNIRKTHHNYTTFYYSIFKNFRDRHFRIFELGLGSNNVNIPSNMGKNGKPGASLYGWEEFFPNAKVYGADIDSNILFETDRIKTYYCDQTNPKVISDMWQIKELSGLFDIIIEDGLHEYNANVCFFENSIHKLNANGYFIIEDINLHTLNLFKPKIKDWKSKYPYLHFTILRIPSDVNKDDNNLIVVKKIGNMFEMYSNNNIVKQKGLSVFAIISIIILITCIMMLLLYFYIRYKSIINKQKT